MSALVGTSGVTQVSGNILSEVNRKPKSNASSFKAVMKECQNHSLFPSSISANTSVNLESAKQSAIKIVSDLETQSRQMNKTLQKLLTGNDMNSSELLALQGKMLNFQQYVMAVSKTVESFVNCIRTTLQTQV